MLFRKEELAAAKSKYINLYKNKHEIVKIDTSMRGLLVTIACNDLDVCNCKELKSLVQINSPKTGRWITIPVLKYFFIRDSKKPLRNNNPKKLYD